MSKTNKNEVKPLIFDTYLAVIKNSPGSHLFRNFYAKARGKSLDITRNGELSCAFFVSSILTLFKMIKGVHGTVDSTIEDLLASGWRPIKKPKIGSILVWEKLRFKNGEIHKHVGFYLGQNRAISNSYKLRCPVEHNWTFGGKRKVEKMFWNPRLK